MPQFDPSSFASQLFWLLVFFVLMYQLVIKVVVPRLGGVMENRERTVDEDLAKASELKARTDAAIETYEAALAEARTRAQAIHREAAEEIARETEAGNHEVGEALARRIEEGEARIAAARDAALGDVKDVAVEVARSITGKLLGEPVDETAARASVDDVMREAR